MKRLYEMGGDIVSEFFSGAEKSMMSSGPGDRDRKKRMRQANRRMKKRGCFRGNCYKPNR
jgi:hypothetical protein